MITLRRIYCSWVPVTRRPTPEYYLLSTLGDYAALTYWDVGVTDKRDKPASTVCDGDPKSHAAPLMRERSPHYCRLAHGLLPSHLSTRLAIKASRSKLINAVLQDVGCDVYVFFNRVITEDDAISRLLANMIPMDR